VQKTSLAGRSILIVEDEPLIVLDIVEAICSAGARALLARTLVDAECFLETETLSAAILDFALTDGNADALCARLNQRSVPVVLHSGYDHSGRNNVVVVPKPASPTRLIETIAVLLKDEGMPCR
jgi:DNA-binding response OmpR family regulator